jgi:hypothetical protein
MIAKSLFAVLPLVGLARGHAGKYHWTPMAPGADLDVV